MSNRGSSIVLLHSEIYDVVEVHRLLIKADGAEHFIKLLVVELLQSKELADVWILLHSFEQSLLLHVALLILVLAEYVLEALEGVAECSRILDEGLDLHQPAFYLVHRGEPLLESLEVNLLQLELRPQLRIRFEFIKDMLLLDGSRVRSTDSDEQVLEQIEHASLYLYLRQNLLHRVGKMKRPCDSFPHRTFLLRQHKLVSFL
mmetsp:Transcript_31551/g.51040  ORF Transcript_31551/g.51040 Transcript_31551/m.51040 type:complete len:203 (-) Transcript_31551:636-1244(-)